MEFTIDFFMSKRALTLGAQQRDVETAGFDRLLACLDIPTGNYEEYK